MNTFKLLALVAAIGAETSYGAEIVIKDYDLHQTKIEQTALQANIAAGAVKYNSGVTVNQSAAVDSDARPATLYTLSTTENELHSIGGIAPTALAILPIVSSESETKDVLKVNSGVPGSASVTNNFAGQTFGGSSSVNNVLPNGAVNSSAITSNQPNVLANQAIAANGNANASGGQAGGASGTGAALGMGVSMNYTNNESFIKTIDKDFMKMTPVILPGVIVR